MAAEIIANMPQYIQFTFTSAVAGTLYTVTRPVPYNLAVYGITVSCNETPQNAAYDYTLDIINFDTGERIFDEPIQGWNIQTDVQTYWKLPSKWWIKKNCRLVCSLNVLSGASTQTYYVTLLCYVTATDPNPDRKPFVYTYRMPLGFQDNAQGTGQTSNNFNQQVCNTLGKHMLQNFELHSITLDPGFDSVALVSAQEDQPFWAFQIATPKLKLFDRMVINGVAGGGNEVGLGNAAAMPGFPVNNVQQYNLPRPVWVGKHELIRVDISPAPTYVPSNDMHYIFNKDVSMALIGNHLL